MMKRFLILTLCAVMLLSCFLVSCNKTPAVTTDTSSGVTTAATTLEEATTGADEVTTEEAATEEVATEEVTTEEVTTEETTEGGTESVPTPTPAVKAFPKKIFVYNNKPVESVSITCGGDASEQYAAAELQKYLEKLSISVKEEGQFPITLLVDKALGEDSYRIEIGQTADEGITITAGNGRGVIYGVYGFLEKYAGVRFFTADLEVCVNAKDTRILLNPGTSYEFSPEFEYRCTIWYGGTPEFSVKSGINHSDGQLTAELGGGWRYGAFVHTLSWMTGTPGGEAPTACLTDPANLQKVIQSVRNILANNPDVKIISVSQNDTSGHCMCANCKAIDNAEGSPAGSLLRFVNAVAENIEQDYPNVVIDTLAYRYTRKAPSITKPRDNVCIRLCSLECCYTHPLSDPECPQNAAFARDLVEWGRICDRIYIWDYTTNFDYYVSTFENLNVLRQNMRFFAEHNVKGVFAQGNGESLSGEFGELRRYLLGKLLMDPYMSEREYNTHMDQFLAAYYGEGWEYIRSYINNTSGLMGKGCRGIYDHPRSAWYGVMAEEFDSWWDQAEALAGDRLEYVKRSRFQWRYTKLFNHPNEEAAKALAADVQAAGVLWAEGRSGFPYTTAEGNLAATPENWNYTDGSGSTS